LFIRNSNSYPGSQTVAGRRHPIADHAETQAGAAGGGAAALEAVEVTLKLASQTAAEVRAAERGATLAQAKQ
jgi:hypothetical protein